MLLPMFVKVPLPGPLGDPPPKPIPIRPTAEPGFEFAIPIVCPNWPTLGSQVVPVLRITWFQPNRASLTRLLEIERVQSPTVLQIGAVAKPFPKRSWESVVGSVCLPRVKRPQSVSLLEIRHATFTST